MTPNEAAERWSETWQRAWEALDSEEVVALYANDALLSTEPFRRPYHGRDGVREYVSGVFSEEEDPRVLFASPIVNGDRAAVSWWASLREEGSESTLAGTSILRFDPNGLVIEQWDTFNQTPERLRPPAEWSPFTGR